MFHKGDIVSIEWNQVCDLNSSIGVGKIPTQKEAVNVGDFFYIDSDAEDLFYIIIVNEECSGISVTISRILNEDPYMVSLGDELHIPANDSSWVFLVALEPVVGVQVNFVGELASLAKVYVMIVYGYTVI
jgi:hypothetical protein